MTTSSSNGSTNGNGTKSNYRIVSLEAENFKRLRAVALKPDGSVIQITGKNGSGKFSLLDAIYCAIAGKKAAPKQPIRKGAESATIKLDLGDVIVTRTFVGDETKLVVEAASGARFQSPQRLLDDLWGELSFDPLAFLRAKPEDRLNTLRKLVPLDVDIDAIDGANQRDYELRREWNRKVQSLATSVANLERDVNTTMDTTPVDVESLTEQMAQASEHNAAITQLRNARLRMTESIRERRSAAEALRAQAKALIEQAKGYEEAAAGDEYALAHAEPLAEMIDVTDLRTQINAATSANAERNAQERARQAHKKAVDELQAARAMSQNLSAQMEAREQQKAEAIARAKMPVAGLSFGNGDVQFNDVPFDQASTAEQIRVSMAIAMAANPRLRVVLIKDGSLLDADSMAIVEQMAEANGFQIFVERVASNDRIGIEISDGSVVSIDGVPVEPNIDDKYLESIGA